MILICTSFSYTFCRYPGSWYAVFLVAHNFTDPDSHLTRRLEAERRQYGDLLIINQTERYFGVDTILPYKTMAFFIWASKLSSEWLMKTDDDAFIHIPFLLHYTSYFKAKTPHYAGLCWYNTTINRDPASKWYVSIILKSLSVFL